MRFGVCIGTDMSCLSKLQEYGYDYAEINLSGIANWTEEQVEDARREMVRTGIFAETCNGFFFSFEKGYLTGDTVDLAALEEYIRRALGKASRLGLQVAVIGSGAARTILDESRREEGEEQFARVLRLAGDVGTEFGVKIVIEPLRYEECNTVNTVADGVAMCRRANHPNVFVLADFYHVSMTGESLDASRTCGSMLQHVHLARNDPDRRMPLEAADAADCARWAAALRENGYNARITLEGAFGDDWNDTVQRMRPVLKVFE